MCDRNSRFIGCKRIVRQRSQRQEKQSQFCASKMLDFLVSTQYLQQFALISTIVEGQVESEAEVLENLALEAETSLALKVEMNLALEVGVDPAQAPRAFGI